MTPRSPEPISPGARPSSIDAPWLRSKASLSVLKALMAGGEPARFVGGSVRDALLGRYSKDTDLDLATPVPPQTVMARLQAAGIKALPTGMAHGTVSAVIAGRHFEITTLREDIACDGRHAEVRFTDDFKADAARRDFTINAMSVDHQGRLFDDFGGAADLAAGRVRFVGDADRRVAEDRLRILRFFRFFALFGRSPVDEMALAACRAHAGSIQDLAGERIRAEMVKLLAADHPLPALHLMRRSGVMEKLLPPSADLAMLARLIEIAPTSDPLLRLAALIRPVPDPKATVDVLAGRWRLARRDSARLARLVISTAPDLNGDDARFKQDLYDLVRDVHDLGRNLHADLLMLAAAERGWTGKDRHRLDRALAKSAAMLVPVFPLQGQDLIDRGLVPGAPLGAHLRALENWWRAQAMAPDRAACLAELERRLASPQG